MDSGGIHVIKLHPNETCSCPVKQSCIHVLSVKLGLRMELTESDLPQNLAVVRKQVREPSRQKPGRKHPRPGDIDGDVKTKQANIETDQRNKEADGMEQKCWNRT